MTGWLVAREKCISTFKWRPSGAVFPTAAAVAFYRPSTDSIQLPPRDPLFAGGALLGFELRAPSAADQGPAGRNLLGGRKVKRSQGGDGRAGDLSRWRRPPPFFTEPSTPRSDLDQIFSFPESFSRSGTVSTAPVRSVIFMSCFFSA